MAAAVPEHLGHFDLAGRCIGGLRRHDLGVVHTFLELRGGLPDRPPSRPASVAAEWLSLRLLGRRRGVVHLADRFGRRGGRSSQAAAWSAGAVAPPSVAGAGVAGCSAAGRGRRRRAGSGVPSCRGPRAEPGSRAGQRVCSASFRAVEFATDRTIAVRSAHALDVGSDRGDLFVRSLGGHVAHHLIRIGLACSRAIRPSAD